MLASFPTSQQVTQILRTSTVTLIINQIIKTAFYSHVILIIFWKIKIHITSLFHLCQTNLQAIFIRMRLGVNFYFLLQDHVVVKSAITRFIVLILPLPSSTEKTTPLASSSWGQTRLRSVTSGLGRDPWESPVKGQCRVAALHLSTGLIMDHRARINKRSHIRATYVLQAVIAGHVSPVQNSEIVLYCRLMRLKKVVAEENQRWERYKKTFFGNRRRVIYIQQNDYNILLL